jgi:hypothetical protein
MTKGMSVTAAKEQQDRASDFVVKQKKQEKQERQERNTTEIDWQRQAYFPTNSAEFCLERIIFTIFKQNPENPLSSGRNEVHFSI